MASAAWFFSTMAQATSALLGILISLVLVVHQINQKSRRTRTKELRNFLLNKQKKYNGVLFTTMDAIQQPFTQNIPVDVDPNEASINEIIRNLDLESNSIPVATKIWLLSYKIDNKLSSISHAESPKEDRLLNKSEINEILDACEYILDKTEGNESELITEINQESEFEGAGASTCIFNMDAIDHPDLDQWFDDELSEGKRRRSLNGGDILSISNLIKELKDDMTEAERLTDNTILSGDTLLSKTIMPFSLMLVSGVLLPISALISFPNQSLVLEGLYLMVYESGLLIITFSSLVWLLYRITDEI